MSQDRRIQSGMIGSYSGIGIAQDHISDLHAVNITLGGEKITAEDVAKFKKLLGFMEFAMSASEELRNLMVAYEAKQRILK